MSYTKTFTTKIVRTKHEVAFFVGTSAGDLLADLARVPQHATVDEILELSDGKDGGIIVFHEETAERKAPNAT